MLAEIIFSPGAWAGFASFVVGILTATGHAPAAAAISDPHTAEAVSYLVTTIGALVSGFLPAPGHKG